MFNTQIKKELAQSQSQLQEYEQKYRVSMAITFDPLSAIKIDPPTIMFYSLFALIDSFHLQA